MKQFLAVVLTIGLAMSTNAQSIFGKWKTIDPDTGAEESIIEVFEKDGKAYAKVIEIFNPANRASTCTNCKGPNKNKPILGLTIIDGLKKKNNEWSGGRILDPKNGNYYKCYLKLTEDNTLKLRGYIGFSLLGRTEYWYRYKS